MLPSDQKQANSVSFRGRYLLYGFLASMGYYLLYQLFFNMVLGQLFPYTSLSEFMLVVLMTYSPIAILFFILGVIIFRICRIKRTLLKILADILLSAIVLTLLVWLFDVVTGLTLNWAGVVFNAVVILLGMEVVYYVVNFRQSMQEAEKQRQLALQYQYDSLKAQINPHFLFNSLNILHSLVSINSDKSADFVLALSSIYRYILSQQGKQRVLLKYEMEFLAGYLEVLSMRYHNQFEVEIEGDEIGDDQEIVPYTLQLLVENVTKHNIISNRHHMRVRIKIEEHSLTIENPIVPRECESTTHVGLNYLTSLYQLYGREFRVENDGQTFRAIVPYL